MRAFGRCFWGIKGVDFILRTLHHPDHRSRNYFETEAGTLWGGPRFHVASNSFTEWTTYFYGSQDRGIHRWIKDHAKPDWVCLDVGMNFGFFTCLCAQHCREVHAFEPIGSLVERARSNCALNGFSNVVMNQVVLSNVPGEAKFHLPPNGSSNLGTGSLVHGNQGDVVTVKTITLDGYCRLRAIDRLDFMKIDVEGAEHLVIEGGLESLSRLRPTIVFENNGDSFGQTARMLRSRGYDLRDMERRLLPVSRGKRLTDVSNILALPS